MGDTVTDLNSGVMSLRPSRDRFDDMMRFWAQEPEKFFLYRKAVSYTHLDVYKRQVLGRHVRVSDTPVDVASVDILRMCRDCQQRQQCERNTQVLPFHRRPISFLPLPCPWTGGHHPATESLIRPQCIG